MRRLTAILVVLTTGLMMISCSLDEPCRLGTHWDIDSKSCQNDTPSACGFEATNCYELAIINHSNSKSVKCIDGTCSYEPCETGKHWDSLYNDCVEDTADACGFNAINCNDNEGSLNHTCIAGVCHFDCDDSQSYYHQIADDETSICIQRCECDLYSGEPISDNCTEDKINACIAVKCDNRAQSENDAHKSPIYCIYNSDDFRHIGSWIESYKKTAENDEQLKIYLINDIDLSENNSDEPDWLPIDLDNVQLSAFGDRSHQKYIRYSDKKF